MDDQFGFAATHPVPNSNSKGDKLMSASICLPDFLPGRLVLERGTGRDYAPLEHFHYLPKRPATWAGVWVVRYIEEKIRNPNVEIRFCEPSRVVAIGVLSYPVASCKTRERYFSIQSTSRAEKLKFVNENLRTISRVIVHPQFRSLGLAGILVRCLCENCPTRFIEAFAMMGRAHPFFEKAGMRRIDAMTEDEPLYFIFDRQKNVVQAESA
jgi:GNAT superfamily N-acetyltransferase